MRRPPSISVTTPTSVSRWTSGTYTYDGAGNVKAIGTHTFTYDKVSRLTAANLYLEPTASTTLRTQTFGYDAFGNLLTFGGSSARNTLNNPLRNNMNRSFAAPFLAIHLIPCVFSFATVAASAAGKEYLECPKHLEAKSGSSLVISCKIRNVDKSTVYILKEDFFLEGPVRGQVYLFVPTGWQRFENTLQYSHLSSGLDLPTLVDPVAHLDFSRAQSLFVLPADKSVDMDITWKLPPKPGYRLRSDTPWSGWLPYCAPTGSRRGDDLLSQTALRRKP
jgi:hypothetical protein